MLKKKDYFTKLVMGALLVTVLMLAPHFIGAQMPAFPIDNTDVYTNKNKPSVLFDHDLHTTVAECMDCHHQYKNGQNVLEHYDLFEGAPGVMCRDCHALPGTRFQDDYDPSIKRLEQAYHSQCITCHRETVGQDAAGPRTCMGCHQD
jgi:hypothetical protein